jgi:TatD DNase family protein
MRLIDTHSHIHDGEFDADRDATIGRARDAGVELILALGVDLENSKRAVALSERHGCVLAAAGVHPHDAAGATDAQLDELAEMAKDDRVAVVGEIGLDFYRNLSPRDRQLDVLRRQLRTAQRAGKPIAVHAREAHEEMLPLLTRWSAEMGGRLPDGRPLGVMHYFSADAEHARRYIELGFVISIHTSVTHPKASMLAEVARQTPLEHLVIETDSPYGAPQRYHGHRNEPAYVAEAAAKIAELKGIPIEQAAEVTTRNAMRLLGIADTPLIVDASVAGGRSRQ